MIKLNELIQHLQKIAAEHGDASVYLTVGEVTSTLRRVQAVDLGERKLSFDSEVRVAVELTTELTDP